MWLHEDDAHARAFDEVSASWQALGALLTEHEPGDAAQRAAADQDARPPRPATQTQIETRTEQTPTHRVAWRETGVLGLTASVIFGCMLLISQLAAPLYETKRGEQQRLVLADGTIAVLNTQTRIRVHYDAAHRHVELLDGEAWFDVRHDPRRPFSVTTRDIRATALGTAFAVRQLSTASKVGVSEGTVQVADQHAATVLLQNGEQLVVGQHAVATAKMPLDSLAWRSGQLVYDNVTLAELLDDLGRYLPQQMVLSDDNLEHVTVSAVLQVADQEAMLEALSIVLPLRWKQVSDNLVIITPDAARET